MTRMTNAQAALLAATVRGQQYPAAIDRLLRDADKMLEWLDSKDA